MENILPLNDSGAFFCFQTKQTVESPQHTATLSFQTNVKKSPCEDLVENLDIFGWNKPKQTGESIQMKRRTYRLMSKRSIDEENVVKETSCCSRLRYGSCSLLRNMFFVPKGKMELDVVSTGSFLRHYNQSLSSLVQ